MKTRLVTAAEVDANELQKFLARFYSQKKCLFLKEHGEWLHRGAHNRWVLIVDGQIGGYCSLIPTQMLIKGKVTPAVWWVDLVIAPELRGKGLQTVFDQKIRSVNMLKLGFPNHIAAQIHAKHNWGVRNDLQVLVLPLRPFEKYRRLKGLRGLALKTAALALTPFAQAFRLPLLYSASKQAYELLLPSAEMLTDCFLKTACKDVVTTYRDTNFFNQRYLTAPYRNELRFFAAGNVDSPSHILIVRMFKKGGCLEARILDLISNSQNKIAFQDLMKYALRKIAEAGAVQVAILVSEERLKLTLLHYGFLFRVQTRFCWLGTPEQNVVLSNSNLILSFSDSDNDEP